MHISFSGPLEPNNKLARFFLFVYSATAISAGEISSICINCNETSSLELSGIQFDSLCVLLSLSWNLERNEA